jgi:RNA polymerase sigma factor (sigma-70 family)
MNPVLFRPSILRTLTSFFSLSILSNDLPNSKKSAFPDTRWSLILASRGKDTVAREAMEEICRAYWYPVYGFVRGMGQSSADAEDLTQGFFEKMTSDAMISRVSPERGKLRSYVIAALKNFVFNAHRNDLRLKREGGATMISIDQQEAEGRFLGEASDGETLEQLFERRWAIAVLDAALRNLRHEYEKRGEIGAFETLSPLLIHKERGKSFAAAAEQLGITESAVRVATFRLRKRYRSRVREEVANTVAEPSEIDGEIDALFAALSRND